MTARHLVREAKESIAERWTKLLMPLLVAFATTMGAVAMRQSKEAKEDNATTAQSVGAMIQDNAHQVARDQAERRQLLRLEARVAFLEARLARRDTMGNFGSNLGERVGLEGETAPAAKPLTLFSAVGSAVRRLGRFFGIGG